MGTRLTLGVDDTDSPHGMCTTYVMYRIIGRLRELGCRLVGFPRLVRLNPVCPHKTRGNAALSATFLLPEGMSPEEAHTEALGVVLDLAEVRERRTNPALVSYSGEQVPEDVVEFSREAVKRMVSVSRAVHLIKRHGMLATAINGPQGLVGALSAVGYDFPSGYTYELIAYRVKEMRGTERRVERESVFAMDRAFSGCTFDNVDREYGEVRITPHTPCPVLLGIRGTDHRCLPRALGSLRVDEPVEGWVIYKTNQATDDHIVEIGSIGELEPYTSVKIRARVSGMPEVSRGGHAFVEVSDGSGSVRLAAYEPTKSFRNVILKLRPGDEVVSYGSYRPSPGEPPTINLERIEVLGVATYGRPSNPRCPVCGSRMKSEGRGKGYSCEACGYTSRLAEKELLVEERELVAGTYEVPARARRHLSRPIGLSVLRGKSLIDDMAIQDLSEIYK